MKKGLRYLAFGLVVSCLNILVATAQPTLDFARGIGGTSEDYGTSIVANGSGNIYTTGVFAGTSVEFNPGPGGTSTPLSSNAAATKDFYLAKYSNLGFISAATDIFRVGYSNDDFTNKIYVKGSNVYIVGNIIGQALFARSGITGFQNGGSGKGFIAKYNDNLDVQWTIGLGTGTAGSPLDVKDIAVDADGYIYVTGQFQGTVNFNPGTAPAFTPSPVAQPLTSNGGVDMFVAKYSSTGALQWAVNAGGASSDAGLAIGYDDAGNVYVTGIFRGQNVDFDPSLASVNLSETGGGTTNGDVFVAKYSAAGDLIKAFNFGNALFEGVTGIAVDADGDFALSGYFTKDALPVDFDPDPVGTANAMAVGTTGTDLFIAKYSADFGYQWHKTVGSTGNEKANGIKLSGSNLFLTGSYEGTATDFGNSKTLTATTGAIDAFVAGYSFSTGSCLFASSFGVASAAEEGLGVDFVNNKLYVTGYYSGSGDHDPGAATASLTNAGGRDIFFAQYAYTACTPAAINTQPAAALTSCIGGSAIFSVEATDATSYQWKKDGVNITDDAAISGATTDHLTVSSLIADNAGNYTVEAIASGCGSVTSSATVLTVKTPATIGTQPTAATKCVGETATFSVVASGTAPFTYQWKKGSGNAPGTSTSDSYTTATLAAGDGASYKVEVSNGCPTPATSNIVALTVKTPASIGTQPTAATKCVGETATFTVVASGTAPFTYQWKKGSGNAPGTSTSDSYTTPTLAAGDGANYNVEVSNGCPTPAISNTVALTVKTPASIGTQPTAATKCVGETATFNVVASGTAPFTYQWKKGSSNAPGTSTSDSYTTPTLAAGDGANYNVEVSNGCPTPAISNTVALTVKTPATIGTQPTAATKCVGETATFNVVASGTAPFTYQWKKGSGNAPGTSTSDSYTTPTLAAGDGASYNVEVSNGCPTPATSNIVALTVKTPASIGTQPTAATKCVGETATFNVVASGTAPFTYQWKKGSGNAPGTSTSDSYTTPTLAAGDGANYNVEVSNGCPTPAISNTVALTVKTPATIGTQPTAATKCVGETATFNVVASGTAPFTYQWKKGSGNAPGTSTSDSYTTPTLAAGDGASYKVEVSNGCPTPAISNTVALTVKTPATIGTQPTAATKCVGETATFNVVASGTAPFTYQWKKGSGNAPGTSTSDSYTTPTLAAGDGASYKVEVSNGCPTPAISNTVALTVKTPASIGTQPTAATKCVGETATFNVVASGTAPFTYQWKKGSGNAPGTSTSDSYTTPTLAAGDGASYKVEVSNGCPTPAISNTVALTVKTPATIGTQPTAATKCVGETATFNVVASGTAPFTYQWKKGSGNAPGTSTSDSYTTPTLAAGDGASYKVEVSNGCPTPAISNTVALTVKTPASIGTQPTAATKCVGETATFNVVASGTAPFTYQWKKGSGNAPGTSTSDSYTTSTLAAGDGASYKVEVSNGCPTPAISNTVTLTVNSPVAANAGSVQVLCNVTTAVLAGSNPSPGTGAWTTSSGATVVTPSSATSNITGLSVGASSVFTWTVTNGACVTTSNVTITSSSPAVSDAGSDQGLCDASTTTMAATGSGVWLKLSGNGTVTTPSSPTSGVTGLTTGSPSTFRWTVTNGACSATDDVMISVTAPGSANAGSDQALCNTESTTLAAAGSGTWSTASGSGVATDPTNKNSPVSGLTIGETTVLTWTVAAGACSGTDQVNIVVSSPAVGTASDDQILCSATTATLSATGTGTWSKTSGTGVVSNPSNASSGVTGLTVGSASTFTWTVVNGACQSTSTTTVSSYAPVAITAQPAASTALCPGNTFNLNVTATGSGALTYQWKKGILNASGPSTGSSYSIPSIVSEDAGDYTVDVTNYCGTLTSSIAQLTMPGLAITTQPVAQIICPGASATFNVVAEGASLSYQWKKDNVDIFTETGSSLTINNAGVPDEGNYTVLVSGCSSTILSDAAALTLSVCTGTEGSTSINRFEIYPNPAVTTVHLKGFLQDPIKSIMIVDVNGQVIYSERNLNAASHDLSVAAFHSGLYHVILFTASGDKWIEKIEVAK